MRRFRVFLQVCHLLILAAAEEPDLGLLVVNTLNKVPASLCTYNILPRVHSVLLALSVLEKTA